MNTRMREETVGAWVDCVSLFHDALYAPESMTRKRRTQLDRLIKNWRENKSDAEKRMRSYYKFRLFEDLTKALKDLYKSQNLKSYNNFICTDSSINIYCVDLGIAQADLALEKDDLELALNVKRREFNGAQEHAIRLILGATKSGSANKGTSRTAMLENRKKFLALKKEFAKAYLDFGSATFKNPLEEFYRLGEAFYKAQWFARKDRKLDMRLIPKKKESRIVCRSSKKSKTVFKTSVACC